MEDKTALSIVAIICILILDVTALCNGIDGTLLLACVAAIAGLAGYKLKSLTRQGGDA